MSTTTLALLAWEAYLRSRIRLCSECHIASGLSQPRKAQLIRDTHQSIGSDPKIINVVLEQNPTDLNREGLNEAAGAAIEEGSQEQPPV